MMTTPLSLPIPRRDLHFELGASVPRWWHGGDCHRTRLFDALSIFFPEGERFFIESVRNFRDRVEPGSALAADVLGFIGQEAMHGREHRRYNQRLADQGAPIERLEAAIRRDLDLVRRNASPARQLAVTICLEHFTAILAHEVLARPGVFEGADPHMTRLWRWHAMEETEHKGVAYEVFLRAVPDAGRRYRMRCWIMLQVSLFFTLHVWSYLIRLVRLDGRGADWRGWARLLRFMFVQPGTFRHVLRPWLSFFRPSFHPWQHDNRAIVEAMRSEYETAVVGP